MNEKLLKNIVEKHKPFKEEVDKLSEQELKNRIAGLQEGLRQSEEHKANNEELKARREELSMLSSGYREVANAVRLKTRYILELLEDRKDVK